MQRVAQQRHGLTASSTHQDVTSSLGFPSWSARQSASSTVMEWFGRVQRRRSGGSSFDTHRIALRQLRQHSDS